MDLTKVKPTFKKLTAGRLQGEIPQNGLSLLQTGSDFSKRGRTIRIKGLTRSGQQGGEKQKIDLHLGPSA